MLQRARLDRLGEGQGVSPDGGLGLFQLRNSELKAKRESKKARHMSVRKLDEKIASVELKLEQSFARILRLLDKPDLSTGWR